MEENEDIPFHVFDRFKLNFNVKTHPNIIRTKNITKDGITMLTEKNKLLWSNSIYDGFYVRLEGIISWGSNNVFLYFKKIDNESTYRLYILTDNIDNKIEMLFVGLNKFFTIDKI